MSPNVAKCLLVSRVLAADGLLTENERSFLDRRMREHGLSDTERRAVESLDGVDAAEAVATTLPEDERRALLAMLKDAAAVDGRSSPMEVAAIAAIAQAIGLGA